MNYGFLTFIDYNVSCLDVYKTNEKLDFDELSKNNFMNIQNYKNYPNCIDFEDTYVDINTNEEIFYIRENVIEITDYFDKVIIYSCFESKEIIIKTPNSIFNISSDDNLDYFIVDIGNDTILTNNNKIKIRSC